MNLQKNILLLILISFIIILPACKKKGCTDNLAENYNADAKKDDGTCTYASEKFIGTYNVSMSCLYGGSSNYTITVTEGPAKNQIIIGNFGNDGVNIKATVSGANITFNEDQLGIIYEGDGYMVGNSLSISFESCETVYYPCSDPQSCTKTCVKQ